MDSGICFLRGLGPNGLEVLGAGDTAGRREHVLSEVPRRRRPTVLAARGAKAPGGVGSLEERRTLSQRRGSEDPPALDCHFCSWRSSLQRPRARSRPRHNLSTGEMKPTTQGRLSSVSLSEARSVDVLLATPCSASREEEDAGTRQAQVGGLGAGLLAGLLGCRLSCGEGRAGLRRELCRVHGAAHAAWGRTDTLPLPPRLASRGFAPPPRAPPAHPRRGS